MYDCARECRRRGDEPGRQDEFDGDRATGPHRIEAADLKRNDT